MTKLGINVAKPGKTPYGRRDRQKWLLLYNCQVLGLGNSLNMMCDEIDVEHYDPVGFRSKAADIIPRLRTFDRILVAPQLEHELEGKLDSCKTPSRIPTIAFNAYHPDICYLLASGNSLKGPLGDYHSVIAYAAFRAGLNEEATLQLFREGIYSELGYFNTWDSARETLLARFSHCGFDISPYFVQWCRTGAFMYSVNHPRVNCVRDIARAILSEFGFQATYDDALPHDNLANGPIFPIYPPIAERLGVKGSYRFKLGGKYQYICLEQFITASHALYRDTPGIELHPAYAKAFPQSVKVMEAADRLTETQA